MRYTLAFLGLVAGCAVDVSASTPEQGNYCLHGLRVRRDTIAELRATEPLCTRDDDCVLGGERVEGRCGVISSCGELMHRSIAVSSDTREVGEEMCQDAPASIATLCSIEASCASTTPVCRSGRCMRGDDLVGILNAETAP